MGKRNRARTRAIRAEMARNGQNYTRAAAVAVDSPAGRDSESRTDVIKEHVVRVLQAQLSAEDARYARAEELERAGKRIVTGGQVSQRGWQIRDWRTDKLLAEGEDGIEGYDAATQRLDPQGTWFHEDHIDGEPEPYVETPGVPRTLGRAIEEWIGQLNTPDEEIAQFIGWSADKVREHR